MTAYIAGGVVVVLIIAGVIWSRLRAGHSDRRSMETYGHGLAALGDVTRRSGSASSVRVLPGGAVPSETPSGAPTASGTPADVTVPRPTAAAPDTAAGDLPPAGGTTRLPALESRPSRRPSVSMPAPGAELQFEDPAEGVHEAGRSLREPTHRATGAAPWGLGRPGDGLGRQSAGRKLMVAAIAVVAVAAIVTAAVLLTLHPAPHRAASPPTTTAAGTSTTTTTTAVTTTTTPVVAPISTTGSTATFKAPSGRYTLRFSAGTSPCWVGIEPSAGAGTYLWSETVQAGSVGHYRPSGPVVVQLGAPEYISVTLDGVPLKIPSGVTYYELIFAAS